MEAIPLAALLPASLDPTASKVHFAVWDGIKQPIDVLATNQEEWQGWNSWRSVKDDFNREFIFSHVLERESYWKEVLHARSLGHNRN